MKKAGYIVIESCEDYEQILGIDRDDTTPADGVLNWTKGAKAVFQSRQSARGAINRTEHYRLAFGSNHPERKFCRVGTLEHV